MSSGSPTAKLFINYRREDTAPYAGRLYDRLSDHFGAEQVFIDIDQIEPGEDFVEAIHRKVGACDIAIVSIGPDWLTVTDATGQRRLDDPEDFVRMEIVSALQRKIRVIPVLVGGARMPRKQDLPDDLVALSRRNALELSETRFHSDVDRLIEAIEKPRTLPEKKTEPIAQPAESGAVPTPSARAPAASDLSAPSTAAGPAVHAAGFGGFAKPNYSHPAVLIAVGVALAAAGLVWFIAGRASQDSTPSTDVASEMTPSPSPADTNFALAEPTPVLKDALVGKEPIEHRSLLQESALSKNAQTDQAPANEWETIQELYKPETWLPEVQKSAEDGVRDAQFEMGVFYEFGLKTLPQDPLRASEWYRKAAAQGHILAQEGLEDLSRKGGPTSDFDATRLDIRRQSRQQAILNHVLNDLDEKAREAIKNIKGG